MCCGRLSATYRTSCVSQHNVHRAPGCRVLAPTPPVPRTVAGHAHDAGFVLTNSDKAPGLARPPPAMPRTSETRDDAPHGQLQRRPKPVAVTPANGHKSCSMPADDGPEHNRDPCGVYGDLRSTCGRRGDSASLPRDVRICQTPMAWSPGGDAIGHGVALSPTLGSATPGGLTRFESCLVSAPPCAMPKNPNRAPRASGGRQRPNRC